MKLASKSASSISGDALADLVLRCATSFLLTFLVAAELKDAPARSKNEAILLLSFMMIMRWFSIRQLVAMELLNRVMC